MQPKRGVTEPLIDIDVGQQAERLLRGLSEHPWGEISPSVYETGRLVSLAPWLPGHDARCSFLARSLLSEGGGREPSGYDLVPALSATEGLLSSLRRAEARAEWLVEAATAGLRFLADRLNGAAVREPLPDTPGIEVIIPALVETINSHVGRLREEGDAWPQAWTSAAHLRLPAGMTHSHLSKLRDLLRSGRQVPVKVLHSLEVAAPLPVTANVSATPPGTVGASPAATASWLAGMEPAARDSAALQFLRQISDQHGGAVPSVIPISVFERAWVASSLLEIGIAPQSDMVRALQLMLGPNGTPGGAGLPPDADTTSVVLFVLDRAGLRPSLDCLMEYDAGNYFYTWPGERTPSVSTNAHVLDAFGHRLTTDPAEQRRYGSARERIAHWLCDQQRGDGWWVDKWHASPLYPTAASVSALTRWGTVADPDIRATVTRAVSWTLDTQHPDGSWGCWAGTREETAYAVHLLTDAHRSGLSDPRIPTAVGRGRAYLLKTHAHDDGARLWHDKDLYRPGAVVRATVLSALCRAGPGN